LKPVVGSDNLCGIGGGRKDLGDERVGIESDGCGQLFELLGSETLVRRLVEARRLCRTVLVGINALVGVVLIALRGWRLLRVLLLRIRLLAIGLAGIPGLLGVVGIRLGWIAGLLLTVVGIWLRVRAGIGTLLRPLLLGERIDLGQREQEQDHAKSDAALQDKAQILPRFAAERSREQCRTGCGRTGFHNPSQRLPMSRLLSGARRGRQSSGLRATGSFFWRAENASPRKAEERLVKVDTSCSSKLRQTCGVRGLKRGQPTSTQRGGSRLSGEEVQESNAEGQRGLSSERRERPDEGVCRRTRKVAAAAGRLSTFRPCGLR